MRHRRRCPLFYLHAVNSATTVVNLESACSAAWETTAAATPAAARHFSEVFELKSLSLPSAATEDYAHAVDALHSELTAAGTRSDLSSSPSLSDVASDAWASACAPVLKPLSGQAPGNAYLATKTFEGAYATARTELAQLGAQVAVSRIVEGFGLATDAVLQKALQSYEAGVVDCGALNEQLSKRRLRLQRALAADAQELFQKQHRMLTFSILDRYKAQLRKLMARTGSIESWQYDRLQRVMVKTFDAGVAALIVSSLDGQPARAQLVDSFSKQLIDVGAKYVDSAPMQLQALGAMKRRTTNMGKSPRGIRTGVGLVGAARPKWGGGQGNFQSFVGYVSGLNSVHLMFANDGATADSTGSEPSAVRFQPKLSFDMAI